MENNIYGWSDIGSPGKPYPIITLTKEVNRTRILFDDVSLKDAKALARWWTWGYKTCSIKKISKGRYQVIRHETIYVE